MISSSSLKLCKGRIIVLDLHKDRDEELDLNTFYEAELNILVFLCLESKPWSQHFLQYLHHKMCHLNSPKNDNNIHQISSHLRILNGKNHLHLFYNWRAQPLTRLAFFIIRVIIDMNITMIFSNKVKNHFAIQMKIMIK